MIPGLTSPLYTKQKGAINFFHFRVLFDHQNRLIREILTAFETSGPWFKVKLLWKICLSMVSSSLKFKSTYKWFFDCGPQMDLNWSFPGRQEKKVQFLIGKTKKTATQFGFSQTCSKNKTPNSEEIFDILIRKENITQSMFDSFVNIA